MHCWLDRLPGGGIIILGGNILLLAWYGMVCIAFVASKRLFLRIFEALHDALLFPLKNIEKREGQRGKRKCRKEAAGVLCSARGGGVLGLDDWMGWMGRDLLLEYQLVFISSSKISHNFGWLLV